MGRDERYATAMVELATMLVKMKIRVIYGGANVGLMRVLADRVIEMGGVVVGVMPKNLVEREVAHDGLEEMHIVGDMQERKALMAKLSDAFIALPGAYGTFDELFEMLTWNQLGLVSKPVGLLNVNHYFDGMITMLDHAVEERFLRPEHRALLISGDDAGQLMDLLQHFKPVTAEKWIERLKQGKI